MPKYYFTYGTTRHQPFYGGWTEIDAPNMALACAVFDLQHPSKSGGRLNCADVYAEKMFVETQMAETGNFGHKCREKITVNIERSVVCE